MLGTPGRSAGVPSIIHGKPGRTRASHLSLIHIYALLSAGIAVVTVTTAQIKDAREIDEIAVVLSQALGRRARTSMKGLMTRRHELRRLLFSHASFPSPESDGASGDANASYEYVDL